MEFSFSYRFLYDDVALLRSTDPEANTWRLEVEGNRVEPWWRPVDAVIMDAHLNWSTPDLTLWSELREGDPTTIKRAFPIANHSVPAAVPFAVVWNISTWYYGGPNPRTGNRYRYRFTQPDRSADVFEFEP